MGLAGLKRKESLAIVAGFGSPEAGLVTSPPARFAELLAEAAVGEGDEMVGPSQADHCGQCFHHIEETLAFGLDGLSQPFPVAVIEFDHHGKRDAEGEEDGETEGVV